MPGGDHKLVAARRLGAAPLAGLITSLSLPIQQTTLAHLGSSTRFTRDFNAVLAENH